MAGERTTGERCYINIIILSLAGTTVASRTGAGVLGHVGLDAFAAQDAARFVQQGLSLVVDLPSLAKQRRELRERFSQSALGQPEAIAAGLALALRAMWQRWCVGLPAESFEVTNGHAQGTYNAIPELTT